MFQMTRLVLMFYAEKMRQEDFSFAGELANTMDWGMAASDFAFNSMIEPGGCFVLWQGSERVGIATCVGYGRVGWFGNLAVKPEFRRKGAGAFLVKHAVQYLKNEGVETVGLYGYQHLVGFYGRIGFKPEDEFVVLNGTIKKTSNKPILLVEAGEKDILTLAKFDTRCMGWDRKKLFKSVLREKGNLCYYSAVHGEIVGFVVAKVYDGTAEIGPLLCGREQQHVALELVTSILGRLGGVDVSVYMPAKETALLTSFLKAGLMERFRLTRMFLGSAGAQNCIYVPESLERG
jgi:ribosomal protein S18 acetylase RimI-like enzyme